MAVYFSPHGGAAVAVVGLLDRAQSSIRVAAYGLNHPSLVGALVAAKGRGVAAVVKADKLQSASQTQKAALAELEQAGVTVSTHSRLLHDKFAVVDGRWVATGSFNWTGPAENRNRENLLVLDCPDLAQVFCGRVGADPAGRTLVLASATPSPWPGDVLPLPDLIA